MSRLASRKSLSRSLATTPPETETQDVGSQDEGEQSQEGNISPQERIRRVAARTMDLGRSFTSRTQSPSPSPSAGDSRRTMFSLNRKGKNKEIQASQDLGEGGFFFAYYLDITTY